MSYVGKSPAPAGERKASVPPFAFTVKVYGLPQIFPAVLLVQGLSVLYGPGKFPVSANDPLVGVPYE